MEVLQDTYKDTKIGRIPKGWEVVKLKEVCTIEYGKDQKKVESPDGKYGIYGTGGLMNYSDEFLYNKPSVLIGRKGTIDKPRYIDIPFWSVDTLFYTKVFDDVDVKWFYYKCVRIPWRTLNEATGVPSLNRNNIYSFKISLPTLPEQQKIAVILSTVDEQISTTDRIIEKSKELKKGLMQKLFSEGIGHTEFKDTKIGRIPKDWEVVLMKSVCEIKGGYSFKSNLFKSEGKYQVIRIGNLYGGQLDLNRSPAFIEETDKKYEDFLLKENDLISTMTGTVGKRDFGFIVKIDKEENLFLNQRVCRMRALMINSDFLYFSCSTTQYLDQFFLQATGGTGNQVNIGTTHIGKIKIALPPQPEQQKIATILSEADAKIEKEQTQKAQLQALKKGLMQQLLTGKKRVKV